MKMRYFGTDGYRGEANIELTPERAYAIGRFLGAKLVESPMDTPLSRAAVIGKDTRLSGDLLENALLAGLLSSGANAYLLHVTTTPSVAWALREYSFGAGIMISASHNPYYDNGIKIFGANGEKLNDELLLDIERYMDREGPYERMRMPLATRERIGRSFNGSYLVKEYEDFLCKIPSHKPTGLRVGLDCANGSASDVAPIVFDNLGVEAHIINANPNGLNINVACGSTHIEALRRFVLENGLDVGFAFDGDADRCLAVDNKGRLISGDGILYLCGAYMKEKGTLKGNRIVTTVMSNIGLYKALDDLGIGYAKTKVGDRFVYEEMKRSDASLGGEQSGHIIFKDNLQTGDGILTALKILEVMAATGKPLNELLKNLKIYPQTLLNVRVRDKKETSKDPDLSALVKDKENAIGGKGRILVRPSGTEPLIRVMVEHEDDKMAEALAREMAVYIEKRFGTEND